MALIILVVAISGYAKNGPEPVTTGLSVLQSESEVHMSNIPQIKIGNTTYGMKDTEARDEIIDLKRATNDNFDNALSKDESIKLYPKLELGDLYVDNSGNGTYYPAFNRVRTIANEPIKLHKGDKIITDDPENSVFIVYKKDTSTGLYTNVHSFGSSDFMASEDGEYEIVARYPVQAYISDPIQFKSYFRLEISTENYREKLDVLFASEYGDNSLFPYFEMGDLYVDASGNGTYSYALKRIRTIQNQPLDLKAGDILYSTSDAYVFHVYKKGNDGKYTSPVSGFNSGELLIDQDGEYEIVARYPTETFITNFTAIAEAIRLRRFHKANQEDKNRVEHTGIFDEEFDSTIETVQIKTKNRGLLFGIITDTHVNKTNAGYYDQSVANLKRLDERLNFNGIVHLGDIVDAYQESNEIVENHVRFSMDKLLSIDPKRTMIAIGNHDDNHFSGDAEMMEDSQLYGLTQRFNEENVIRSLECSDGSYEHRSSNFFRDYPGIKIRLIFVDSSYQHTGFSTDAIAWAESVMQTAPQGYHFIFMSHCGFTTEMNGGYGIANSEAFNALLEEYKDQIYCYICGHTHFDYVNYPHGFAQIALCCAVPNQPAQNVPEGGVVPQRTIGTYTQDCISIIFVEPESQKVELIRFGAGSDRTIPFTNL